MRKGWTALAGVVVAACLGAAAGAAGADVLRLKNGNIIRGQLLSESATELKLLVDGGVLTIRRSQVAEVIRETPKRPRASGPVPLDVSDHSIRLLIQQGKAQIAAERLARAAEADSAALRRLAGRAAQTWVIAGDRAFRERRFGAAAHAFMQALSFQPAWDRALQRRFYDAALADIRTRLLEQGELEQARDRVAVLRAGLPDDPVAAWLDGRIAERLEQPVRARAAYADVVGGALPDESLDTLRTRATTAAATGVPAGGIVDWQAVPLDATDTLTTSAFVIEHRNAGAAARLAHALRWHLRGQEAQLGRHARRFAPSAPIVIRLLAKAEGLQRASVDWAAGHAHSRFRGGSLQREEIELLQGSAQLLGSALPHELGHLMLARAIGPHNQFPHALAEGFACQFEAPWKRAWYHRVVRSARGSERLTVAALLRARSYPPAGQIAGFYAGSLCLVEALLERGGMDRLVRYCDRAGGGDPSAR